MKVFSYDRAADGQHDDMAVLNLSNGTRFAITEDRPGEIKVRMLEPFMVRLAVVPDSGNAVILAAATTL